MAKSSFFVLSDHRTQPGPVWSSSSAGNWICWSCFWVGDLFFLEIIILFYFIFLTQTQLISVVVIFQMWYLWSLWLLKLSSSACVGWYRHTSSSRQIWFDWNILIIALMVEMGNFNALANKQPFFSYFAAHQNYSLVLLIVMDN